MDGLEISEITISNLISNNEEKRIDSEYFRKDYLNLYKKLDCCDVLGDIADMHDVSSNGSFECVHNILNDNYQKVIPYIRSGDVGETFLDSEERMVKISREAHNALPLSQTILHDVMMARKGKIGGATIITENEVGFNCNENVIKLTIKDKKYNPYYVTTFFNSFYGKKQVERLSTGNVQPWVSIYQIKKLKCYYLSDDFQLAVESLLRKAHQIVLDSKYAYGKAKKLLEKFISISNTTPEKIIYSKKNYSQIFNGSGRLDAEYYQPKYDDLFNVLKKYDTRSLGGENGLVNIKKSIEPGSESYQDEGVPFVRISDVDKFEISNPEIKLSKDIVINIEDLYPKKDTILFSKDGSIGIAYKVQEDLEVVTSGALLHLTVKDTNEILPDYLTLVLNSSVVQLQAERDCNGAIIQHWKPSDIEKVIIPVLDMDEQKEIAEKVQESFRLRKKSKELLDIAIKAVEMAIEIDEEAALVWLRDKISHLEVCL